jgi:hypothetical protein
VNPSTAERCDCGYDFQSKTVERPYFRQRLPRMIKGYMVFIVVLNVILSLGAGSRHDTFAAVAGVLYALVLYLLYLELLRKRGWARITLAVLTFPIGTILLLTRDMKLYMLQKD